MNLVIEDADLVRTLGFDMVEYHPQLWNPDKTQRIVHGDFLPAEIDERCHPEGEVVGDLAHFLWMLNERLDAHGDLLWSLDHQRDACETMRVDLAEYANDEQEGSIRPQKALWDCRQVLGPEDILLPDVGAHKYGLRATIIATSPTRVSFRTDFARWVSPCQTP
jgi:acetolactate synthase-1/2/3 large subunit